MTNRNEQESHVAKICEQLNAVLSGSESTAWEAGDLLVELSKTNVGGKPPTLKYLQETYLTQYSTPYLSQLRKTAEAIPAEKRAVLIAQGITWNEVELARRSRDQCVKAQVAQKDEPLENFLEYIRPKKGRRRINPREIMKNRIGEAIKETRQSRAFQVEQIKAENPKWNENCHHASCLDVMDTLEPESVDVSWQDVPYGQFYKHKDGKYAEPDSKGLETQCDANTRADALELTLEILRKSARILKPNGKMVLFQAATEPDRPEIISLLHELGFTTIFPMYWKKVQPQPGDFKVPFSHETERILIAGRSREAFQGLYNGKGRTDVISDQVIDRTLEYSMEYEERPVSRTFYNEVRRGESNYGDRHFFEKPVNLCKYFLEKLTFEGDTVIDVCGCTGSMIEACIELNRRWVYSESNETNYNLGVSRISEVMERVAGIESAISAPIQA